MSVKSLKKEYQQVVATYHEMLENLADMEKDLENELISPEFMDNLKQQLTPITQNYQWWSYVMYTLDEPERKDKRDKYKKSRKKLIQTLDPNESLEARLSECRKSLDTMHEVE